MRNIAQISRREIEEHRKTQNGITAEKPRYSVVDQAGAKEWVVDVYLGMTDAGNPTIVRSCPIAPIAHELITDVRQPVELERNKQGKLTVVGRAKVVPAGTQTPEGSILDPSYQEVRPNLAELGLLWIADLDYGLEAWGVKPWGDPGKPWRRITITDAFGHVIAGEDTDPEDVPVLFSTEPATTTTTRHTRIRRIPWGSRPWGAFPWGGHEQTTIELEE